MNISKLQFDQNFLIMSLITQHKWLTPYELVSLLTIIPENSEIHEIDHAAKPFMITPSKLFDLKKCNTNFRKVFKILKEDLQSGKLPSKLLSIKDVDSLINPFDGLVWAIHKKISLPSDLQKALSVEFKSKKQSNPWLGKINIMVLTQYCRLLNGKTAPVEILEDPLLRNYIHKAKTKRLQRQIRKDMAIVLRKKERGFQNCANTDDSKEPLKIIPDVLENHKDISKCDFNLLTGVIWTAIVVKTHYVMKEDTILKMTSAQFVREMLDDELISLYVKNTVPFIAYYIVAAIKNFYDLLPEFFGISLVWQCNNVFFNKTVAEIYQDNIRN